MGGNPEVLQVMHSVLDRYGACSGGSRNISGHNQFAIALEKTLAQLHSKPAALCFGSGYSANDCALTVLGSHIPDCVFLSDASNHSSIIDGIRHSRARKLIWKHNDLDDLEEKLASIPLGIAKIICFESIYSMCGKNPLLLSLLSVFYRARTTDAVVGTVGPLRGICDLAEKYGAITFLDEVHAVGLYGPHGAGVAEHLDFEAHTCGKTKGTVVDRIDIITGALGKGFGTMGGYITGSHAFIDMIRSVSRGFIFTTAAPPATMAGARAAIDFQRHKPQDRMQLQRNVRAVKARLLQHGLPVLPNRSHIVPLMVGDSGKCKTAADILFDEFDIYVQPINSPSVAVGQERLRISPTAAHTQSHQDHLINALVQTWGRLGLDRLEDWKARSVNGSVSEGWGDADASDPVWTDEQLGISTCDGVK
ncbi:MAG: hypothetical protein Q9196_006457 [Gyalolechia fulgens]